MDLPATQAIDEDFPATQQLETNDEAEDTVVGTLLVNNKSYPVHSGVTQIGRHPACKIVIDHETVSKKHAEIEAESADRTVFIRDLKSCNKTKINFSNLKPNFNYQVRDGDKLTFGQITATFKLFKALDDSIVSCTPQVNRKVRPIIPGTPDSSMNASSASESDVSIIPGTQTDENFRRPQVPVRTSTSNEHRSPKLPAFILDDLPSPLKEKNKQEDVSELETQRFSNNEINENQDSSIHSAQTQKTVNKTSDTDENIYEMETQRPYNPDEYKDNIENLQTQRCDDEISDITKRKSLDVSICSAETQKIVSKTPIDQGLEYLETQPFDCRKSDSLKNKSMDLSIYSAETQKMVRESSFNENMENLETQRFDCRKSDSRKSKSMDVSIYSAETQKTKSETSQNISIESLETQQYDPEKSVNFKLPITPKRYSKSLPISTGEKSLEDLETQPFIYEESEISSRELRDGKLNEFLENIETQPFEVGKCSGHEKSNLTRKSRISLHEAVTQEIIPGEMVDDLLYDLETQKFVDNKDSTIINESIEDLETQQVEPNKSIKLQTPSGKGTVNETLDKINTSKGCSDSTADQSIDDLETQEFVSENINAIIDESTENVDCQQIDKSANIVSSLSISVGSMETIPSIKEKLPLDKDIQDPEELLFDSGFRTSEQESINSKTNSERNENQNTSNLQLKELDSSSHCVDESKEIDDSTEINNLENEKHCSEKNPVCSSSFQKLNLSEKVENIEKNENMDEDDDNEMFCSQALIEDCPFAFLPDESHIDNKSIHEITKSEKLETNANLNSSQNIKNVNVNVDQESLQEKNLLIKSTDDSETDEEGVFSSHGSKENEIKNSDKKSNESDSETDEEGIFSSHQSKEDENNEARVEIKYNSEIKKSDQPNNKSDSETDEEGVFSSRLSKDNENIELSGKNNKGNNEESNNKDDENSETDEEGVFSSLSNENKIDNSSAKNDVDVCKKVCDGDKVSDSETDEDIFTSNLSKKDSNKMSIKESDHVKEISKESSLSNRNNIDRQKSPTSDVDDIFDKHYDETKNSAENRKIQSTNEISNKVSIDNDEVDELAPTQIIQPGASETEDVNLALALSETQNVSFTLADSESMNNSETIDTSKTKIHEIDDLAPTQIVDSKGGPISEKEDEFLAPTQIVSVKKMRTPNKTHKDDSLAPTQIVSDKESLAEKPSEDYCDLDLAPTQKMPDSQDNESQVPTQVIDERIDKNNKNASYEDLDYEMANTQLINDRQTEVSLTSSKRQLEEIEITSNKKLKTADISQSVKIDLNNTVERNMDEIFEGPEDVSVKNNDSALLTQQLANILESSQIEESLKPDMNSSTASPPLSNKRSYFKGKNRRRAMMLNRSGSQDKMSKPVINLNDTIERNLNEMFDNSINTVEAYESDTMLTQQLENVLGSQDDNQLENEDSRSIKKSLNSTISTGSKKHRLSLSSNLNTSSISKNNSEKQSSKSFSVQSVDKNETTSQESNSKEEESQGTEEYFANLKSKKKRNIFEDSQSDNETVLESSSSTEKVSYRRGTIGFREDGKSVSTKERVGLVEIKGRSFTSDSQSDGEDVFGCTLAKTGGKKRVSLSLSKHVNLNASMSSLSDQEPVEKKVYIEQQRQKQEPNRKSQATTSEKSGNDDPKLRRKSSVPVVSVKRVQAPGTLGFTDNLDPVEGEELASAASTTSEDERQTKQEKVSAGGPETTQTTRMSGLTIIRHKRSAAAEDSQNQPSKRSKPDDETDRTKLQELAQPSVEMPAPVQKRIVRAPKTLDGYVVLQKSAKKEDSSDQSAVDSSIVENKSISASRSRATRGKANTNKKKNNANSSTGSQDNNSSKENVEMEDSDIESCGNTRPSRLIRGGVPPEKHTTTHITDASIRKDDKVDSSSISRSSGSSKENLNKEDSEIKTRCKLPRKRGMNKTVNSTEATEKNSTDEILGSFEDMGTKRTEGRPTRQNQKKAVTVQENSKSNQKATIIKDSDSEQDEESKIVDKRTTKSRRIKGSDSGKSDKTSSSIENDSSKSSKGKGTRRNQKKEILEKDKVEPEQASVIQDSDVEQSQKSLFIYKEPRNKRLKNIKSSDSDKSEITGSENENSKPTRGRNTRRNQKDVPVKELQVTKKESSVIVNDSDSEDSEFVISRNIRTKDIKSSKPVKSSKSQVVEETIENKSINATSTRATRRNQKQEIPVKVLSKSKKETSEVQDSDLEVSEFVKKDYEISRIEETKSSDSQKSDVSSSTGTRSRRGKARNESSDSVFSGSDNDKKKSTSSTNISSRPARQTRKRAAPSEVSVAEIDSSTESQEVADILKNAEKNIEQSRTRGRRRAVMKESVISSSEDTQDSETNNSNDVFEKPVSRAKRARVTKNAKIKSASQPDLDESADSKLKLLQKSAASRKKKSPSPAPIQAALTPTRNRRSISSVSPMKGTSYKVLFTGDKAKAHRKTVTKLGGFEVEDLTKCSILVTHEVVRTLKFLCSLAKGIPIVSVNWLEDSNKAQRFLDWKDYILHDPAAEKKYNFTLKESLEKAKNHKLLDGYNVLLTSHRALPPVAELKEMVISSGGKPLLRAPAKWPENTIVIAKEENLQNAKKLIAKAPKSVTIYSVELILTGILRQDINLQEFRLSD